MLFSLLSLRLKYFYKLGGVSNGSYLRAVVSVTYDVVYSSAHRGHLRDMSVSWAPLDR